MEQNPKVKSIDVTREILMKAFSVAMSVDIDKRDTKWEENVNALRSRLNSIPQQPTSNKLA